MQLLDMEATFGRTPCKRGRLYRRTLVGFAAAQVGLALCLGCSTRAPQRTSQHVPAPAHSVAERDLELAIDEPELASPGAARFVELGVPGFLPAVLLVPESPSPRPLVVASHGAGGDPEWECEYWHALTRGFAFVLCPRGTRIDVRSPSGHYYRTHFALEREVLAAVRAARAEYGPRIATTSAIYAGFSQGAIMGAAMVPAHGREFPYLALIEGGFEYWSAARARKFARGGGRRALFLCGTRWCADGSQAPAEWLRRAGVEVRVEHVPGAGHTPAGAVMQRARLALPWLLAEDPLWSD